MNEVWVFNRTGDFQFFACAIFSTKELAFEWIVKEKSIGILTKYTLDKPDDSNFPEHYHFEDEDDYLRIK